MKLAYYVIAPSDKLRPMGDWSFKNEEKKLAAIVYILYFDGLRNQPVAAFFSSSDIIIIRYFFLRGSVSSLGSPRV